MEPVGRRGPAAGEYMRVLQVNKFLYPRGGDCTSMFNTGRVLERENHEVAYWGMSHPANPRYPDADLFTQNLDYDNISGPAARLKAASTLLYSREARRLFDRMLQRFRPDVVHLHNIYHQLSPSILGPLKKRGIPSVLTLHDYKMVCPIYCLYRNGGVCQECEQGRYYKAIRHRCSGGSLVKSALNAAEMYLHHQVMDAYSQVSLFLSPSRFLMDKFREMGFRKEMRLLPNALDLEKLAAGKAPGGSRIIYSGRHVEEKGVLTLVKALAGTPVTLDIYGDGPVSERLAELVRSTGCSNIRMPGYVSPDELADEIKLSALVVCPSEWYENNPMSILEAFVLGRPVLGSRIGGIIELVEDGKTGLTFTPGDSEDLREKLFRLLESPEVLKGMGEKAREYVVANHGLDDHYSNIMAAYQEAMEIEGQGS
jgi:glycosyltransferase involved in cell wall biosynthesis